MTDKITISKQFKEKVIRPILKVQMIFFFPWLMFQVTESFGAIPMFLTQPSPGCEISDVTSFCNFQPLRSKAGTQQK